MQKLIDEMKRTAENHRALTEPVPVPLLTLERWINRIETADGVVVIRMREPGYSIHFSAVELPQWQSVVMPMAVI